eukprot:2213396-Pyramimonas_sp.AAC.1
MPRNCARVLEWARGEGPLKVLPQTSYLAHVPPERPRTQGHVHENEGILGSMHRRPQLLLRKEREGQTHTYRCKR